MKQLFSLILFITLIIVVACLIQESIVKQDTRYIHRWVSNRSDNVTHMERRLFEIGPYWVSKHRRIYCVLTQNHHEYWFRMGNIFTDDVEEKVSGSYNILQ